jgi:RNA polymerase sigma-70 factor (ECF subfamily)
MPSDRFSDLYENYGPAIYARCCRILDNRASAEDAAQETFLRVHRHIDSVPPRDEALRWMYRIATNYCLNVLRDGRREREPIGDLPEIADAGISEERLADCDLVRRLVRRAPQSIRVAAWLYHVDGLHQHEIARELGVSRRTVVNHLAAFAEHARKFLRLQASGFRLQATGDLGSFLKPVACSP